MIPVPKPGHMLGELRQVEAALRAWRGIMPGPALARGQRVRVIRGPLAGVEGLVARRYFRRRQERLVLNVTMLGQAAMLEIDSRLIQPVEQVAGEAPHVHEAHWLQSGAGSVNSLSGVPT
jgi:hypothetical protein